MQGIRSPCQKQKQGTGSFSSDFGFDNLEGFLTVGRASLLVTATRKPLRNQLIGKEFL